MGQKPFEGGRSNRDPNQSFDDHSVCGVKGMQIGVGFLLLEQEFDVIQWLGQNQAAIAP
jgi:hypothetical protein